MIAAYPTYKESGVEWLGVVPTTWEVVQTKRHFQKKKETNEGMQCVHRLSLTMGGVVPRSIDDLDGLQSSNYEGYQIFEAGDLAFKLIDLQNIKTSRVGLVPERGIMSPAYIRLSRRSDFNSQYAYWYFMALYWLQVFNGLGGGVRQTLGPEELLTIPLPVPSPTEQKTIAAFLDHETGKIDALVEEQKRLIVLLKEKRQTVISHAVTKGLNPSAPMKDSGIEWLGEVPEHWEVKRLKHVARIHSGFAMGRKPEGDVVRLPYLRVANVQDGYVDLSKVAEVELLKDQVRRYYLLSGDLLMNEGGDFDKLGRGTVWEAQIEPCLHQNHVFAVRPVNEVDPYWLAMVTRTDYAKWHFILRSKQTTNLASVSSSNVYELPIIMPPRCEQEELLAFIDLETTKLDELVSICEKAITLLQERRSALISAAVTGKIDVRGFTPSKTEAA